MARRLTAGRARCCSTPWRTVAQPAPYLLGANLTLADTAFVSTLLYLDLVSGALGRDPG